ncbi:MAG: flagellar basal body P-ring formation chaperone FlgA [Hyphomicrobiales bacterium]|nr:flagellar basal body P-ring formation chaperone FlgA [Hyphomicrobiales bacterium]
MTKRFAAKVLFLLVLVLVAGGATARAQEVVLIPNRVIYPGETVDLAALREVTLKPGKVVPPAVAIRATDIEGKVAKRTLLPGRYIPTGSLREAWLVEQGAAVQVTYVSGVLTISASAVTLQSGAAGDLVRVRNIDSGKVLSGVVMADGSIRVGDS